MKKESTSKIHLIREKLSPIGTSFRLILLWPIACLLLSYLVWSATLSKIDKEKVEAERAAYALAASYSKTYAEQITHGIEQIELLTLTLKYYWEHNRSAVSLEDQFQKGLYSPSLGMYLAMTDREGNVVTSTLTDLAAKLADREYFQFHETVPTTALRIDKSLYKEARSGKELIHFTRRLEDPNGNFDGIILAAINHHYFASFSDENSLGPADLISIRHANGTLLVSEKGKDIRNHGQIHIEHPVFETDTGVKLLPAPKYRDHKARVLAWHKITGYPLVAYVGLEQERLMESHIQSADSHRKIAAAITLPLLVLAILGLFFFTWLALRRKHAAEIKDTYYLAIDAAREGFYVVRALYNADHTIQDFIIEDCNERGAELIGYSKKTLIGVRLSKIYSGQQTIFRRAMESGFYEDEFKVPAEVSSQTTWVHRRLVRFGEGLAITLRDISEAKMHERVLVDMANTDALTKLPNRHWLTGFLPIAIESAKASKSALALLYIDLDDFKNVNDSLGHIIGDDLLKAASSRLKSVLRPEDHIIRLGGDEFTILLKEVTGPDEVAQVATRVTEAFQQPFDIAGHMNIVSTSIGISLFPQDGSDAQTLLQKADFAMYSSKHDGKGKFRFYDPELYEGMKKRQKEEQELTSALANDQFVMYFQPRANAWTGEVTALEALVRWNHPQRGLVFPNDFIPLSEKTELILPLGELILEKVCAQLANWLANEEPVVPTSVNISASQFNAGGVDTLVASLLSKHAIPAELLEIELTESAMTSESPHVLEQVAALSDMGVKIHVDDFGTGYSSLSRLQEFNMDVLKIDRAFTSKLGTSKEAEVLFKTIVLMAKALSMKVVAEGVETQEQLKLLQRLACDEVQGYLLSRPVPPQDILPLMRKASLFPDEVLA